MGRGAGGGGARYVTSSAAVADRPRPWWSDAVKLAALLAFAAAVLWLWGSHNYRGLCYADDIEYASIARNVARGQGVTSQFLNPFELQQWGAVRHPSFLHAPGEPLLIAAFFRVFGVSDFAAVLPSALAFVLVPLVVFLIARRLHGEPAAWCAAVVTTLNPQLLRYACLAMAEAPSALLLALAAYAALRGAVPRWAFAAGLALGIAQDVRETFFVAVPGALVLVAAVSASRASFRKSAAWLCGGFAVAVLPLVVRSVADTGRLWFSFGSHGMQAFTQTYPHLDVHRMLDSGTFSEFLSAHGRDFAAKVVNNLATCLPRLVATLGIPLTVVASGQLARLRSPVMGAYAVFVCVGLALTCAALSTFTVIARYFIPFVPLLAALGAGAVPRIARWRPRLFARSFPAGVIVLLCLALQLVWDAVHVDPVRESDVWRGVAGFVAKETEPGATIVTDAPECVIWTADRNAVWVPKTADELRVIESKVPVQYVLLTSIKCFDEHFDPPWGGFLRNPATLTGHTVVRAYDDGKIRAVLWRRN